MFWSDWPSGLLKFLIKMIFEILNTCSFKEKRSQALMGWNVDVFLFMSRVVLIVICANITLKGWLLLIRKTQRRIQQVTFYKARLLK